MSISKGKVSKTVYDRAKVKVPMSKARTMRPQFQTSTHLSRPLRITTNHPQLPRKESLFKRFLDPRQHAHQTFNDSIDKMMI
jgi:hypothetical protein